MMAASPGTMSHRLTCALQSIAWRYFSWIRTMHGYKNQILRIFRTADFFHEHLMADSHGGKLLPHLVAESSIFSMRKTVGCLPILESALVQMLSPCIKPPMAVMSGI